MESFKSSPHLLKVYNAPRRRTSRKPKKVLLGDLFQRIRRLIFSQRIQKMKMLFPACAVLLTLLVSVVAGGHSPKGGKGSGVPGRLSQLAQQSTQLEQVLVTLMDNFTAESKIEMAAQTAGLLEGIGELETDILAELENGTAVLEKKVDEGNEDLLAEVADLKSDLITKLDNKTTDLKASISDEISQLNEEIGSELDKQEQFFQTSLSVQVSNLLQAIDVKLTDQANNLLQNSATNIATASATITSHLDAKIETESSILKAHIDTTLESQTEEMETSLDQLKEDMLGDINEKFEAQNQTFQGEMQEMKSELENLKTGLEHKVNAKLEFLKAAFIDVAVEIAVLGGLNVTSEQLKGHLLGLIPPQGNQ